MKILVCISVVPDTTSKINFTVEGKALDKSGIQFVINPYDEFSLTRAIWFQEKAGAEVTVITVGDASVEPVMRKALAIGADKAVRIDGEPEDDFSVASQIARYAQSQNFDLILTGKESIDYNGGIVPGLVAAQLDYGFINSCIGLEIESGKAVAWAEADGGKAKFEGALPLVVAGQKGLVEETDLRIPNMRGIMQARTKPLEVISQETQASKVEIVGYEKPEPRGQVKLFDPDNIAGLVEELRNKAKVI